jgi:RNA polymerase sigma-70 factor (ECF subfamily)
MTTPAPKPDPSSPTTPTASGTTRKSLLVRVQSGEPAAWEAFTTLYRPLMVGWLRGQGVPTSEIDDLVQEIFLSVVRSLPRFDHSGRVGAFRAWLRSIACSRILDYWRSSGRTPPVSSGVDLSQLEDPDGDLARRWDAEHDRYVFRCLLDVVEQEFEPTTVKAFRRLAIDDAPGAVVAAELGLSVGAVYVAKSRVLQRIRREAEGLID